MKLLALIILLSGCSPKPAPSIPASPLPISYESVADRLVSMMDRGWVVSRDQDEAAQHKGDALLFTGLALGALDCERGNAPEAALMQMFTDTGGGFYRHPDIPDEWSLDGAIGVYWGALRRAEKCPDSADKWRLALLQNQTKVDLDPFFGVMRDSVIAKLSAAPGPDQDQIGKLGAEVDGWAIGVVAWKQPAYRLHLGYLVIDALDAPNSKTAFCEAVKPAKMPLLEDFCARPGLQRWMQDYAPNIWEYAHQRSPEWETPDGKGLETPGLDYLMAVYQVQ